MTIKDIAKLSGYGIGTVSRVINNHPGVSDKTRKAVMKVIEETGFQPNSNAKFLKMRASSSIAIIVIKICSFRPWWSRSSTASLKMTRKLW